MSKLFDALQNAQAAVGAQAERPAQPIALRPAPAGDTEMLRLLQAVDLRLPDRPRKVIQVLASGAGEGASTIAGRLAQLAAGTLARRTLLLATTPVAGKRPPRPANDDPLLPGITRPGEAPLYLGSLYEVLEGDAKGLTPEVLRERWTRLRAAIDLVVVDTPPLADNPIALAVARSADGTILVVQAERTRIKTAEAARDALLGAGVNLLGAVLNRRRIYVPRFIYDRL